MSKRIWMVILVGLPLLVAGGWFAASGLGGLFPEPPPPPARPETVEKWQEIDDAVLVFRERCERCHSRDGTGSSARPEMTEIPDFTSGAWQAKRSDSQLLASILDGKGERMPAFRKRTDDKQARQVIAYIRAFDPARKEARTDKK